KIEGFFDVCSLRGLSGTQGVIIPASNIQHLMLKKEVLEAASQKQFFIHAVETIDEGVELLTGVEAGQVDASGKFAEGSVNYLVRACLNNFALKQRSFSKELPEGGK
ncbi:MAG: ATP-dependent protease, partial [Pseudomonadales bacterium]|nr:ATP-dependent protease [Pseudomonadales bacterium]